PAWSLPLLIWWRSCSGCCTSWFPKASVIAVLHDPNGPETEVELRDLEEAGRAIGRQILIVKAVNERELHAAIATVVKAGTGGVPAGWLSAVVDSFSANGDNSWHWRAGMPCPRSIMSASTPRLAA